jgi:uncharacterized protein YgiM (DUF1202 family)
MILSHNLLSFSIFSLVILTNNLAVAGQADRLPTENQCLTRAYVIDSSRQGLNVRRQPNSSGKILGRLPHGTDVNILGAKGDWMLISVVDPVAQKVSFQGEGWVYSSLLGTSSKGYDGKSVSLYSRPSFRSRVAMKIPPNTSVTIVSCTGKWLKVKSDNNKSGWLEPGQQCSSTLTNCS